METDRSRQGEEGTEKEAMKGQNRQTKKALANQTQSSLEACRQYNEKRSRQIGRNEK